MECLNKEEVIDCYYDYCVSKHFLLENILK
jgi:hypothetical protein